MSTVNSTGVYNFISSDGFGGFGTVGAPIGYTGGIQYVMTSPAGTDVKAESVSGAKGDINARLYFSFVKSKLSKTEQEKLKPRLLKLKKLIVSSKEMGQQALYEQYCQMAAIVMREQEAWACGIEKWIDRKDINKFMGRVEDRTIKFGILEEFPRPIPKKVRARIKDVREKKLFDKLHVLYIDHTKEEIKTNKDKIKQKDPILFGTYAYQPDRFYFIIDWVDDHCDLTIDKVVNALKEQDEEFALNEIPDIDDQGLADIRSEVEARHQRLNETNSQTWRDKVRDEEVAKIRAEEKEKVRKELLEQAEAMQKKHGGKANPIVKMFRKVLGKDVET